VFLRKLGCYGETAPSQPINCGATTHHGLRFASHDPCSGTVIDAVLPELSRPEGGQCLW
jgi:hypothetical protein